MKKLTELLQELEQERFFGSLEAKFESGKIVLLRKSETIKPEPVDHRNNRGQYNVEQH
jgi:hypothetical protein